MRPLIWSSPVSQAVPFDNASNGFTATDAQAAIEEARDTAIAKPRFSIVTTFNGVVSNNQWLGYDNLVPGNSVPIVIPIACTLREISFAFANSNVDGQFDLYKNGLLAGDIVHSTTFTNENVYKITSGLTVALLAGDLLRGRWVDGGDNPADMVIVYFPQIG